jgi:predicted small secreted protein
MDSAYDEEASLEDAFQSSGVSFDSRIEILTGDNTIVTREMNADGSYYDLEPESYDNDVDSIELDGGGGGGSISENSMDDFLDAVQNEITYQDVGGGDGAAALDDASFGDSYFHSAR